MIKFNAYPAANSMGPAVAIEYSGECADDDERYINHASSLLKQYANNTDFINRRYFDFDDLLRVIKVTRTIFREAKENKLYIKYGMNSNLVETMTFKDDELADYHQLSVLSNDKGMIGHFDAFYNHSIVDDKIDAKFCFSSYEKKENDRIDRYSY